MALASYDDLVAECAYWLVDRTDLVARIPTFLALTEAQIYRRLRIRAMETAFSQAFLSNSATLTLPSDFKQFKFLYVNSAPDVSELLQKSPDYIYKMYPDPAMTGVPQYYAITGDTIIFGRPPNSTYTVTGIYYAKLAALSATNQTNWFTANASDLLLYGMLAQGVRAIRDDATVQSDYDFQFERRLKDLEVENTAAKFDSSRKIGRYIPF